MGRTLPGRAWLRGRAFETFYRLPAHWRRRIIRLGTAKYIVGAVVLLRQSGAPEPGRLLLLHQPPRRGWSLPGGLLKRGEAPVVGAARELYEETGVRVDPAELTAATPNAQVHNRGRWIDMVFEARVPAEAQLHVDGAEVHEAAWHPLDALPQLTTPTANLLAQYGIGPLAKRSLAEPPAS
ncbi:MAG: NUDIX hydrolase [Micromonosporaceae bacterium]|nr:NUDIX hydrolase [Micromonosporaceae bacterium]